MWKILYTYIGNVKKVDLWGGGTIYIYRFGVQLIVSFFYVRSLFALRKATLLLPMLITFCVYS